MGNYWGVEKMIRDTLKNLFHEKLFLVSIGISILLEILVLIIAEYGRRGSGIYEIVHGFGFFSIVGYSFTIGRILEFLGFGTLGYYPNLALMYFFIILFWSLIIYSILKITLILFKGVRGK